MTNPQDTARRLTAIVTELSDQFLERASAVRTLVVAMLAGQHSLLLGPPGTAKSELARELTGRIDGARYWEILLSKFTDPKRMFGPVDVAALTRGEYTQVFAGRATQAEIAFIDEIFKCSAGALNETLAFLNERLYHPENGGAPIACPLISAITAGNELPSGEELGAVYDRLLVRLEVGYLQDPSSFAALVKSAVVAPVPAARTTVDLGGLQAAVATGVPAVEVPDAIVDAVCTLRAALRRQELVCSDRRWKQAVRLLQASAYLDGREALDLLDAVEELEAQLDAKAGQSREALSEWAIKEANSKLSRAARKLGEMREQSAAAGRSVATLDQVIGKCRAVHARVMVEALGVDASMVTASL